MKKYNNAFFIAMLLLLTMLGLSLKAQEAAVKKFEVDGIKVLFKPSVKDVISVRMFVEGGASNYAKAQEGIESLTLNTAVMGGTTSRSKIVFNTEAEKIGTTFEASSSFDFGEINMDCVKQYWDKSWDLFSDIVLNPAFNEKEFNIVKEQLISAAQQEQADPDTYLDILAMANTFKGKDYAKIPNGTPESLKSLTLQNVKDYYKSVIGKKSCFLVVVGNVREEDLKSKIIATLAKMQDGKATVKAARTVINKPEVVIEDREIATNYLSGIMMAPLATEKESLAMKVAISILNDRFFLELRTNRSLSYAPASYHRSQMIVDPYNVLYITTLDPKTSTKVMVEEVDKVREKGFTAKELLDKKQTFLTYYFLGLETNSAQTKALGALEMAGDYKLFETLTSRVNTLTLDDLNKAFKKYSNTISWSYLGKKDAIKNEDFPQPVILGSGSLKRNK